MLNTNAPAGSEGPLLQPTKPSKLRDRPMQPAAARVRDLNWAQITETLDTRGYAVWNGALSADECASLADLYPMEARFRSRVVMARHNFGRGEYKYFSYPLPRLVGNLRTALYPPLAVIANRWNERMGVDVRFPKDHRAFLDRCHRAGQNRPTPLMLRYTADDYNCLHQDLYGEHLFPLQVVFLLSAPGLNPTDGDFSGGEFVLTEQRPRMQSRVEVVPLNRGDAVIFPVRHRPVVGSKGDYRVTLRHGVSRVRSGERQTLGLIFHDAQ